MIVLMLRRELFCGMNFIYKRRYFYHRLSLVICRSSLPFIPIVVSLRLSAFIRIMFYHNGRKM